MAVYEAAVCLGTVLLDHPMSPLHGAGREWMGLWMGSVAGLLMRWRVGAHYNPAAAIVLLPWRSAWRCVGAQLFGSVAGAGVARMAAGPPLGHGAVRYAALAVGQWEEAFLLEWLMGALWMALLAAAGGATGRWTPVMGAALTGIFFLLPGAAANPARAFAGAVFSGEREALWVYFVAPTAGMQAGALLHRYLGGAKPGNFAMRE